MSTQSATTLPLLLIEGELARLAGDTQLRYEENGGAKDIFVNDEWSARASLFPGMDWELECGGCTYGVIAEEAGLRVEKR
ncbi:hypothetical protein Dde_2315 [Oleidesulfovibrio alaskensis G20]|jgi:hypothetical protein|uniref:Uncharacterized protein n=1 Tax=Oleidesulfovibrio alaskensis (strain ATCC BAA-1058 / DSM 17464 / G20) TaxID=207559 RepID=Q30YY4_OLEA2|nr:hypothetical protein [Oleidesulfovibrio alaskensis]ABB39112.2 hypothetical protein Dde_2315 [Oleidesulfovibrio alaskensis G20]MBG0772120.1 hypothetical protein [Oleidesulfovibrio alaskensis]MBL3581300.1 hypothetical protein [Oleidesulfovibrio alaskensis]